VGHGGGTEAAPDDGDDSGVSSLEDSLDEGEGEEARDTFDERLAPPVSFGTEGRRAAGSPVREARFHEEL